MYDIDQTYDTVQYGIRHLHVSAIAIQEDGAKETNLFHRISGVLAKIDPVTNIERVQHKQKDDTCENIAQTRTDEPAESYKGDRVELRYHGLKYTIPRTNVPAAVINEATSVSYKQSKSAIWLPI